MTQKHARVLLVDDYPDALEIWSLYFQMLNFNVLMATDGKQALELAVAERPDVIIMDLELPSLTGFEVARQLRARPDTRDIPLIAATGYSHARQLEEAKRAGFDVILVKPCDPALLVREVETLLGFRSIDHTSQGATFGHSTARQ